MLEPTIVNETVYICSADYEKTSDRIQFQKVILYKTYKIERQLKKTIFYSSYDYTGGRKQMR